MLNLQDQGALIERFAAAKPDYILHAEKVAQVNAVQHENDLAGQKSGSVESVQLSSAAASKNAHDSTGDKAEKAAKQRAADMLLQALLNQIADLDVEIDAKKRERETLLDKMEDIQQDIDDLTGVMNAVASGRLSAEDAMQNPEVAKIIRDYEQRKGTTFDANADGADDVLVAILGANVEQRAQEYNDLGQRVEDIDTDLRVMGTQRDALRARIGERDVRALTEYDATRAESRADADSEYVTSEGIGTASETIEFATDGRNSQEVHRDLEIDNLETVVLNEDGFGGFGAALELASADVQNQFQTASLQTNDSTSIEPPIENKIDVGMQT